MNNIVELNNFNKDESMLPTSSKPNDIISIADDMLLDVQTKINESKKISMPIVQLSTLGAGVASLLPIFRTITQTTSTSGDGLYRLANATIGDTLKVAKNGNFWGALKTIDGTSKFAQFQSAGPLSATSNTVMPIDPVTLIMSIALFSIEKQLGNIADMQKQIISFLEIEKESKIEADIETLSSIMTNYKHNWDNEHFIATNHKMVGDIRRDARQHINSYQKRVKDIINDKQFIVLQSKINNTLEELQKNFKYYRLSIFTFSMSSLIEIMLSGNFKEENILSIKKEIEQLSLIYREIYSESSLYLETAENASIETNLLKGVGIASKKVSNLISNIPIIKDGQVDEFFEDSGNKISNKANLIEKNVIESFLDLSNPATHLFTEKMDDLIQIYNHTSEIYFDNKNIYLIAN